MIKLDAGNVLLKPSQRKQLNAWLKRSLRLGERLGSFVLTVKLHRIGKVVEMTAEVQSRDGAFNFRSRQADWRHAARQLVHMLSQRLHLQQVQASM